MAGIRIKDNESFEVAIRRFKRTIERTGLLQTLRELEHYEKPTTTRKRKHIAAIKRYQRKLRNQSLPQRFY